MLVNGNYWLWYQYGLTFWLIPVPKCWFWQFSDISVSVEISARVGTKILAIKNSFLKGNKTCLSRIQNCQRGKSKNNVIKYINYVIGITLCQLFY
jgi:hypothetical protein